MSYDLFISYAHRDNASGQVRELAEATADEFHSFAGRRLRFFFDEDDIPSMADWERRIARGLRESRLFLAVLSPNYFASPYCLYEWEEYVRYEAVRQCLGEGVAPIYFVELPDLDGPGVEASIAETVAEMRKRQWCDLTSQPPIGILPWHSVGKRALEDSEVVRRLTALKRQLAERLGRADRSQQSLTNIYRHNPQFVGRIRELTLLRNALNDRGSVGVVGIESQSPGVAAVHGLGGMGKTELALAYSHAFAWDYPGGRWLVRCDGLDNFDMALRQLADPLQIELTEDEKRDSRRAGDRILAELRRRDRLLLLLDNVSHADLLSPDVLMRLPPSEHLHLLATTRLGPTQIAGSPHDHVFVPVDQLPAEDAIALIRGHQPNAHFASADDLLASRRLVEVLAGFTLAVETAAIYLGRNAAAGAINAYTERLAGELLESEIYASAIEVAVRHKEKLLERTLSITLESLSDFQDHVLSLAACLPPDQVALPWLRATADVGIPKGGVTDADSTWRQVTDSLLSLRLLQDASDVRVVRMHRMVQHLVRKRAGAEHARTDTAMTKYVLERGEFLFNAWADRNERWEIPPLLATALLWLKNNERRGCRLASAVQWPLQALARWPEAEVLLRTTVAVEKRHGGNTRGLASALNNLAKLLEATQRHREAEEIFAKVLDIDQATRPDDDPKAANHLNNLGELMRKQGRLEEAESLFRRALALNEKHFDARDINVARSLNNLGLILVNTGRDSEGEPLLRRAIDAYSECVGTDHPDMAIALNNLGTFFQKRKQYDEAARALHHALAILEASLGDDHPQVGICLTNIALCRQESGCPAEAEPLFRRVLEIDEKSYGPENPEIASDLLNLIASVYLQGRFEESETLLHRQIEILAKGAQADPRLRMRLQESVQYYTVLMTRMGHPMSEIRLRINRVLGENGMAM